MKVATEEMLNETAVQIGSNIIIESDNCSSQYKSCQHFYGMQLLANHYDINMICIFGIAENGKGEVDHIGGLTKTAIRREIAAGEFFSDASDMVMFLKETFEGNSTKYFVEEIDEQLLQIVRADNKLKDFISISGSTLFQVILFKPTAKNTEMLPKY